MLEVREIYKTFNDGTINEKRAMNGVTLTLNAGGRAAPSAPASPAPSGSSTGSC